MSKLSKLEKDLKSSTNGISSWHIIMQCRTTNPQKLIQQLRKKYGYDKIVDRWEQKKECIDGQVTLVRWKRYFWQEEKQC